MQALTKTCGAFGVTHDVALGILAWAHELRWQVKGSSGSVHQEMAGAFNVTECNLKAVAKCWEQGFDARLHQLR